MYKRQIVGGDGDPGAIADRVRQAQAEVAYLESDYEREKRRLRVARLSGSVALIRVGLDTQAEQEETRHRIRDAVRAGRAALADGIVPGGGATLLRSAEAIPAGAEGEDERGREVVRSALEAPLRQLAENAGLDPSMAVRSVRDAPLGHGIDIETNQPVDLVEAGIFDPARIVRSTLEIAASVARSCLRAEVIIAHPPSPRRARRGHGHGHGHDHDHGHEHDHHAPQP